MRKRITALFLVIFLFMTNTVYAEEVLVESKGDLNNNLTSNNTVILISDISTESVIQIVDKQSITIDLNGFYIKNTDNCPIFQIKNCQNIRFIDSSDEKSGAFLISLTNGDGFGADSPYAAIDADNSTVSIEGIKIDFTSKNKGLNTQLFNLSNQSELQLIGCDITTKNIGNVINANNSKVYLGKDNQEIEATNLPNKLTNVTVENLVVPSNAASGIQNHTGAICLDNDSLIEVFANISLKSYVMQTDDIDCKGSAAAILSNNSAVNIYGGTVENICKSNAAASISLYAIEAYKPSETNGLVISYKANEFDTDRKYGTEIISNQDTIFVSPVEMGAENYDNQCENYKITLDYASVVSGDGRKAITSISKYSKSGFNNIVMDSKCALIYGNVIYRQGLNESDTQQTDKKYSYSALYNDENDDINDKYIVLTRDLEIDTYSTLFFQDVNVAVAKGATLKVLGVIENNKASGVNNSKLQINGQYELRGKCHFDIYVYGRATIYELTNGNMYPKDNGDIYFDTSVIRFVLKDKLIYNKERQIPVFDAYFGNRLVKDLSPGNTIEFEQNKQFKVSGSTGSLFTFAGTGKIVDIIRINNSSTNSHFYLNGDTTATFSIEKADFSTLNPGKNLRAEINIKSIRYGYKESVSLVDFLYDDDKREYQWYREVNGEQIAIQDETEYEYIIREEDIGNKIFCQVSFGNYKDVITSDKVTVSKGTARNITFPTVSEISYPQKISTATLTEGSTNGTFSWENPDEVLTPGTYTRNLIFTPNDSNLYDYSNAILIKPMTINVNKGVPAPIVFPEDANTDYPSSVKSAVFTGASTNGTFAWENPDEQLPPGNYTRKIIFTPNDSELYDYSSVELIKEVQLTVNKADPQKISPITLKASGLTGNRKITLCYQVFNKPGVDTPTGKVKFINRVIDNSGTQTDKVIAERDLVYGKSEIYEWNIANDNNYTIIVQYSGDDYYNSSEISTSFDTRRYTPEITIDTIGQKTYGDTSFDITVSTDTNGLPVALQSSDESILSIEGNAATIHKAGKVTITAKTDETEEYSEASKQVELTIDKATSNITADAVVSGSYGNRMVAFSITVPKTENGVMPTGTVKIVNKTGASETVIAENLSLTDGTVAYDWNVGIDEQFDIEIVYSGDNNYKTISIQKNIDTRKKIQSVTVDSVIQKTYGDDSFEIAATATSGEAVTLISSDDSILSINGNIATIHKAGTVTCTAIVAENSTYNGNTKEFTVEINKKNITIKANNVSVNRFRQLPAFTYEDFKSQLVTGDIVITEPSVSCSISDTSTVGTYDIVIDGALLSNHDSYSIEYINALLTIKRVSGSSGANINNNKNEDQDKPDKQDDSDKQVIENKDGSTTTIVSKEEGSTVETTVHQDGTTVETITDKNSNSETNVVLPENIDRAIVNIPIKENITEDAVAVIINSDGSEKVIGLSVLTNDSIKLMINDDAKIIIKENKKNFDDIPEKNWYTNSVYFVAKRGIFTGVSENNFAPHMNLTRGMFATVIARLSNKKSDSKNMFDDINGDEWYADSVNWLCENGIANGYGKDFKANNYITREEMVTMMYRYAKYMGVNTSETNSEIEVSSFIDANKISSFATPAIEWAVKSGIINGKDNNLLDPKANITRAEACAIIERFVKLLLS